MSPKPTTERLAKALGQLKPQTNKLRSMIKKAKEGYYDDYKSPIATPLVQLAVDIEDAGHPEFVARIVAGEFDGTKEESDAWAASPEGRATFAELLGGNQKREPTSALYHQFAIANPGITKALTQVMFYAYREFCNAAADKTDPGVQLGDALMSAHNIHCWIIQSMEQQFEMSPAEQLTLRKMAVDTFKKSMEERE